jgi:hypothetical protein
MKDKINRLFAEFLIWAFDRAFKGSMKPYLRLCIEDLYREIAKERLPLKSEIVRVKKGKKRFDLLFFETANGKLKFDLGRHFENTGSQLINS